MPGRLWPVEPPEEALDLAVLPGDEELAGVEDRRVGAADDADQQREHEHARRAAAKEEQRQQREDTVRDVFSDRTIVCARQ